MHLCHINVLWPGDVTPTPHKQHYIHIARPAKVFDSNKGIRPLTTCCQDSLFAIDRCSPHPYPTPNNNYVCSWRHVCPHTCHPDNIFNRLYQMCCHPQAPPLNIHSHVTGISSILQHTTPRKQNDQQSRLHDVHKQITCVLSTALCKDKPITQQWL